MKKIYDLVKKLSDEFSCFEVQVVFAQETDEDSGESLEVFNIVLFSELYPDPLQISITTNPKMLEEFDLEKCLQHFRFELSCLEESEHADFYYNTSLMLH